MSEPTAEQLAEWRRLADAATAGPWARTETIHAESSVVVEAFPLTRPIARFVTDHAEYGRANAEFVAAARQAVPALVGALDESRRRAAKFEAQADRLCARWFRATRLNRVLWSSRRMWQERALSTDLAEARRRAAIAEHRLDCLATVFKHAPLRQPVPGGPMHVEISTAAFQMAYDGGAGATVWREQGSSTDA